MSGPTWALVLDPAHAAALGPLRRASGLEVCRAGDELWVRGAGDEAESRELLALPALRRYGLSGRGELLPRGARLPVGAAPIGPWWPLARWLAPGLPPETDQAAPPPAPVALELVPAGPDDPAPPAALLCLPLAELAAWVESAPAVRLQRLELALDGQRALVRGDPLPPLPGQRLALLGQVALPLGWSWRPRLDPEALALALGLLPGELALLLPGGSREQVPSNAFAPLSRAGVRSASG